MATDAGLEPLGGRVEWVIMWTVLAVALWTIIVAAIVTAGFVMGVWF